MSSRVSPPQRLATLFVLTTCALAPPAVASEWSVDATATTYGEFASNPRLLESPAGGAAGVVAKLAARLGTRSSIDQFEVTPTVVVRQFDGDYALSGTDLGLGAAYRHFGERAELALSAQYLSDDASTSGFDSTGYFESNVSRETISIGAEGTVAPSERALLLARVSAQSVRFESGASAGLVDYDYVPVLGYVQHELSKRTRLRFLARAAFLHAPATGLRSDEYGAGVGLDCALDERWSASLDVGPSWLSTNDGPFSSGLSYRASVDGQWLRTRFSASASRLSSPTAGRGVLETRDDLAVSVHHDFVERWSATGGFSLAQYATNEGAAGATENRTYGRAFATVDWKATERWTAQLAVTRERQEAATTGEGTRVTLGMVWNGRVMAVSR